MSNASRRMALGGVLAALGAGIMLLGGVIPAATFCCPVLASLVLVPAREQAGPRWAWLTWAVIALLSLILSPDKESALLFAALGYYPVLKPGLDRLPRIRRLVCKFALFNAAVCASYALMLFVLRMDALRAEFFSEGKWMLLALILGGNAVFFLYDLLLNRISPVLRRLLHAKRRN